MRAALEQGQTRPTKPTAPAFQRTWVFTLALVALTVTAFLPVVNADFLNFDDPEYVTANPTVLKGLHAEGLRWAFTSFEAANWHPLTWVSHMLDVSLFGLRSGPHHLVNLALHTTSAVLLLVLINGITGAWWPSLLTATLFAIHPLRVESVAWIAERKDVLSVLLGLLTLLAYLRYLRRPSRGRYVTIPAVFALCLMAKPTFVTLPVLLLLLDWWPLGRFHPARHATPERSWQSRRRILAEKAPLLALSAISGTITWLAQQTGGAMPAAEFCPPGLRVANAMVSCVRYIGMMLWPRDLIPFYVHPGLSQRHQPLVLSLVLIAGITALALALHRRHPWLLTGWFWYLLALVPVSGLVQVGEQAMADRYSYLPMIGMSMALAWEACRAAAGRERRRAILAAGAIAVIAALAALTWRQSTFWRDTTTLFGRVVTVDPRNYVGYDRLGADLLLRHEPALAVPQLRTSLEISPWNREARYNLGLALAATGDANAAAAQFLLLVGLDPKHAESFYHLGKALVEQDRVNEGLQRFEAALALRPDQPDFLVARSLALARLGRRAEAVEGFHRTSEVIDRTPNINSRREEAYTMVGANLLMLGEAAPAASLFRKALAENPGNLEARYNLGLALTATGDADGAIEQLLIVSRANPRHAEVLYNLGKSLLGKGQPDQALQHLQAAVAQRPDQPEVLLVRGIALARLGREAEAVVDFRRVIELDPGSAEARTHLEAAQRSLAKRMP